MLDDDPRRAGHRLTVFRAPLGPRMMGGQRLGMVGRCSCDPAVRFEVDQPPSSSMSVMRGRHEAHIEQVVGPPVPALTRAQRDVLLSYDPDGRRLTRGRPVTWRCLERVGLIGLEGGRWVPTVEGFRVLGMLSRARRAA